MFDCMVRDLTTKKAVIVFFLDLQRKKTPKTLDSIFYEIYLKAYMNQTKLYKLKILLEEMYLTKTKKNDVIMSKIPD